MDPNTKIRDSGKLGAMTGANQTNSWAFDFTYGFKKSLSVGLGMVPLGIAFGMLVIQSGAPWWLAPVLSTVVYAGSVELLLVTMLVTASPLATIYLTTFLVNSRHIFYSLNFPLPLISSKWARLYAIYALTDETYAITVTHPKCWNGRKIIALQVCLQSFWVGGGILGTILAQLLPGPVAGLEFALTALFVVLALDAVSSKKQIPSVALAILCYLGAVLFVSDAVLFTAMATFCLILLVGYFFVGKPTQTTAKVNHA